MEVFSISPFVPASSPHQANPPPWELPSVSRYLSQPICFRPSSCSKRLEDVALSLHRVEVTETLSKGNKRLCDSSCCMEIFVTPEYSSGNFRVTKISIQPSLDLPGQAVFHLHFLTPKTRILGSPSGFTSARRVQALQPENTLKAANT